VPGKSGFAQLRLESPVVALPHERFIIRSYSPQITIAGGHVLDSNAARHRGREMRQACSRLETLATVDRVDEFSVFVEMGGERGLRHAELVV